MIRPRTIPELHEIYQNRHGYSVLEKAELTLHAALYRLFDKLNELSNAPGNIPLYEILPEIKLNKNQWGSTDHCTTSHGLCAYVETFTKAVLTGLFNLNRCPDPRYVSATLKIRSYHYPEFSGDGLYPIKGYKEHPHQAYHYVRNHNLNMYDTHTQYGQNRWWFLMWMFQYLDNRIKEYIHE